MSEAMRTEPEAPPIDEHDPASLKHGLEAEVAHKVANGVSPEEASEWARAEQDGAEAQESGGVLLRGPDGSVGRYHH